MYSTSTDINSIVLRVDHPQLPKSPHFKPRDLSWDHLKRGPVRRTLRGNLVWIPRVEMILFQVSQHSESQVSSGKTIAPKRTYPWVSSVIYNKARAISLYRVQVICGFTWESVSPNQFFQCWISLGSRTVISQQTVWYWNAPEGTVSATTSHTSLGSLIILPEFYHSKPMNLWPRFLYQKQTLQLYLDQEIKSSTTQPARIIPEKDSKSYSLLLPKNCPMNTSELCFKTFQDMYT